MSILNFFHSYLPSPVIVEWGPWQLHWYGALVGLAALIGYWLVRRQWLKSGRKLIEFDKLFGWLLLAGLVGARLLDVFLFEWWYFQNHLVDILYFWQGGLSWHGGLLGGAVVLGVYYHKTLADLLSVADIFAPALAVGQAIGRWGNYFNQELFGLPTDLPWGIPIARTWRPWAYVDQVYFQPVFLYESVALLFLALGLWYLRRQQLKPGSLFVCYLLGTGIIRFGLEFIRLDEQSLVLGLRSGLLMAAVIILAGIGLWLAIRRRPAINI